MGGVKMKRLKERLSTISAGKVLDIGVGRGQFAWIMAESFKDYEEIIGIDVNPKILEKAKKNLEQFNNIELKRGRYSVKQRLGEFFLLLFFMVTALDGCSLAPTKTTVQEREPVKKKIVAKKEKAFQEAKIRMSQSGKKKGVFG